MNQPGPETNPNPNPNPIPNPKANPNRKGERSARVHEGRVIQHEIAIDRPTGAVWEAWADPAKIAQWFVDRAEGFAEPGRVVKWFFDAVKHEIPQPVLEAERGKSFVTGSGPTGVCFAGPGSKPWLLEVTLQNRGGSTLLRLVNSGFDGSAEWDDEFEGVNSGWQCALAQLKHRLERHPEGERSHRFVLRTAPEPFAYERLLPFFTTSSGLARWLGDGSGIDGEAAEPGRRVRVRLDGAPPLDGEVLCRTARELLFSWPECDGTLALKTFAAGKAHVVALDWNAWGPRGAALASAVAPACERALDRLCRALEVVPNAARENEKSGAK